MTYKADTKIFAAAFLLFSILSALLIFGMIRLISDEEELPYPVCGTYARQKEFDRRMYNRYAEIGGRSAFLSPLPPGVGRISGLFGVRRLFGVARMHNGLDVAAPSGTPVFAARSGRITRAGYYGGYGNMVEITHRGGLITRYAHCSRIFAETGEWVGRGEVIAETGDTGRSTGPHLHFEILIDGDPVDPIEFINLKRRY